LNKVLLIFTIFFLSINIYSSDWKTLNSKHFKVHYKKDNGYIAQKTIEYLININSWLTKYMKHQPKLTNVVISDSIDDANGFARVIPYNLIHIYPYPPEAESVLGYYNDWLYILVLHEYLHIVHIDTKGVISDIINSIFGKLMAPNQVLPKFITEGLAVYFESLGEQGGRLNSPLYKMMFRTSILNSNITLSELSNQTSKYPYGGMVYLYGSFFINYIFKYDYNFLGISNFTKNYGDNVIPYGINTALKNSNGKTFSKEYDEFILFYKNKFNKLYEKIKKEGITKYTRIVKSNKYYIPICENIKKNKSKSISDFTISNNNLYMLTTGPEDISYLYKYTPNTKKLKKIMIFNDSVSNIEILDDKLYYVSYHLHKNRTERRFSSINLDKSFSKIEIDDLRVVNFAFNKNNYDVALVVNNFGIENIYMYNLKSKKLNKLTNFKTFTTIGVPYFINNKKLLISINQNNELWNIKTLNIDTKKLEYITNSKYFDISPTYIDNKIFFISDREDDILNLYQLDLKTNEITKKTNFFTGIKKILYNKNEKEFYALRYQEDNGFEIISISELDTINKKVTENIKDKELLFLANKQNETYKKTEFSIFPEILPQNIMPQITASNFQNNIGVEISNNDVREYYSYYISANYLLDIDDLLLGVYFSDYSNYFYYSLGYSYTPIVSDSYLVNGKNTEFRAQYHTFNATVSVPFYSSDGGHQIYFSASDRYFSIPKFKYEYDPWDIPPKFPEESDKFIFSFGYYFSDSQYTLHTPSSSEGESLNLRVSFRDKSLLATYNSLTFAISYKNYYPIEYLSGAFAFIYNLSLNISESGISKQYIGGYPNYGSLTDKLIDRTSIGGLYLRGYPQNAFSGTTLNLLNLEYRQHLFYSKIGYSTLPFYIHKFYIRFFYDIANITDTLYEVNVKKGLGVELTMQFLIGYFQPYNLSLGYAKGVDKDGENQIYLEFISLF
jgi:hypothetical protein